MNEKEIEKKREEEPEFCCEAQSLCFEDHHECLPVVTIPGLEDFEDYE